MGRQMIVPYRLARMPVHALIWTVLCKIVVFKSPTQTHSEEGSLLDFNSVVVCACVCVCVREREWACVWEISRLSVLSGGVSVPRHFIQQNSQPENCVSDVMSWLLKKPKMRFFFFSLLYFQSQYQSNVAHSRLCCLHVHKKKIKCSQPHPSVFLLCIHGNKNSLFCLLGLYQRCPRRLAHNCVWKQVSMLFLCTSPV